MSTQRERDQRNARQRRWTQKRRAGRAPKWRCVNCAEPLRNDGRYCMRLECRAARRRERGIRERPPKLSAAEATEKRRTYNREYARKRRAAEAKLHP